MRIVILHLAALLTVVAFASCAHEEKRPEEQTEKVPVSVNPAPDAGASIETKQVAAEANAPFSTEVRFEKGQSSLSRESRGRLDKILKSALKIGTVDEIQIFAWADQEYPNEQAKKLPPKARELAQSRGDAISAYYFSKDSALKGNVKVVTMTERPSGLSATLKTGDTRSKENFEHAGLPESDKKSPLAPKASRAAVMIVLKR